MLWLLSVVLLRCCYLSRLEHMPARQLSRLVLILLSAKTGAPLSHQAPFDVTQESARRVAI